MNETVDKFVPKGQERTKAFVKGDTGSGEVSLPFLEGFIIEMEKLEIPDYREHPL